MRNVRQDWVLPAGVALTLCGTLAVTGQQSVPALSQGALLSYEQIPRTLTASQTEPIRVVVEMVGDVPVASFRRNVPTQDSGFTEETWRRSTTRTVGGRMVSVFEEVYPGSILDDLLVYAHGNDFPQVPLGRFDVSDADTPTLDGVSREPRGETIWLKVAPSNLPVSTVRAVAGTDGGAAAQYASHVVNLVVPGFGDARLDGGVEAFEFEAASQAFYQHFADTYHTLAFIPRRAPFSSAGALNVNVKNDIEGIGAPSVDRQAVYGSSTLRSVQLFAAGFAGHQATTVHQIGHHWGDETSLATIAGVAPAGQEPARHTPLLHGGATLVGAVLAGTREVELVPTGGTTAGDSYRIKATTPPVTFHPLQLYRMGFLMPSAVPDVTVFVDQAQFNGTAGNEPEVGTVVTGERRTVTINEIMAALGPRSGPVFTRWRQAFVVVSDELVSQSEMDYFNFFAQRASAATGTRSYDGYGSFIEATGSRVTLETEIDTRDAGATPKVNQALVVSDVPFGESDWRGLVFDDPVPSRIEPGEALTLTGRIDTDILPDSYQFIVFRAARHGAAPSSAKTVQTAVSGGRFTVPLRFARDEAGAYVLDAFVFADEDSPAIPTSAVTPLFVD